MHKLTRISFNSANWRHPTGDARNREVVKKFLAAATKGWEYAQSHPEEALDLMYKVVGPALGTTPEAKALQGKMVAKTVAYLREKPDRRLFQMDPQRWHAMATNLMNIGRVSGTNVCSDVCDFRIVDEAAAK